MAGQFFFPFLTSKLPRRSAKPLKLILFKASSADAAPVLRVRRRRRAACIWAAALRLV